MNEKGELVTESAQYQISPVPELAMDLDNVINREDQQLQTVGHHWPLDGPLPKEMRYDTLAALWRSGRQTIGKVDCKYFNRFGSKLIYMGALGETKPSAVGCLWLPSGCNAILCADRSV